ncbi:class II aldolase/adducin family protein [soil metagenome]
MPESEDALDDLARREIIRYSKRLVTEGLITGTAGNISLRRGDGLLITPSGLPYDTLTPSDVCLVDSSGVAAHGTSREPSSELQLHRAAYAAAPKAAAVVHFHGLRSTAVATTRPELPVIHYYAVKLGGTVPVVPYSTYGSQALAEDVGRALHSRRAALMANHGAVTVGRTLEEAFQNALLLEWLCHLYIETAALGPARRLTEDEVAEVAGKYAARAASSR